MTVRARIGKALAALAAEPPRPDRGHDAALTRVRELHRKASHGTTCVYCAPMQRIGYDTTWPCDTIRVLDDPQDQP